MPPTLAVLYSGLHAGMAGAVTCNTVLPCDDFTLAVDLSAAVDDPDNSVAESNQSNNRTQASVTIK